MNVRFESWYVRAEDGPGWFRLRLVNAGPDELADFQLAFQSVVQLTPVDPAVTLVSRRSGHHVVASDGVVVPPGRCWDVGLLTCGHRPRHANDGPVGAYVVHRDGATRPVRVAPSAPAPTVAARAVVPALTLAADAGDDLRAAAAVAARCEQRLWGPGVGIVDGAGGQTVVRVEFDAAVGHGAFVVAAREGVLDLRVAALAELPGALLALARARRNGDDGVGVHRPRWTWRGLHIDLARQFFPSDDVLHLIDVAAWHGLNRLHLHLTDDEGWRVPIAGYPALTDTAAYRGHGLMIPPLLGSGPDPYGGSYTRGDIAGWAVRAGALGVELVPEIDLPGHCFAARAALAELVDPADTTSAASLQHFTGNVLDPGLPSTWRFLEAVFESVADLFAGRWLHVGGDEVPTGAWSAAPAALAWAAARGLSGATEIEAAFLGEIVRLARDTTGCSIGVWQDVADGGLPPGEAYVVGWRSAEDCRRLAAAGHDVVAGPAEVYYLDMAESAEWHAPGTSWAGHTPVDAVAAFDPAAGWSTTERARLLGIQAALWTEHVPDRPALERLLYPRLAAVARAAWTVQPPFCT